MILQGFIVKQSVYSLQNTVVIGSHAGLLLLAVWMKIKTYHITPIFCARQYPDQLLPAPAISREGRQMMLYTYKAGLCEDCIQYELFVAQNIE